MLPRTGDREQAQEKDKRGDKVLDREQAELLQKEDLLILKGRLLTQTIRFLIVPKM
jgi:cytidylate kinase